MGKKIMTILHPFFGLTGTMLASEGKGIFLGLFWGQISAPTQSKNEQKLPKIVNNISNSLALQSGENFRKI